MVNVIVFIFDSLRADRISCMGYSRETTPNIDSLVDDGVVFTNAFSQAIWTGPSSGSILTSLYPLVHRTGFLYNTPKDLTSIADGFSEAGYVTGCISTAGAVCEENYPGFDDYHELFEEYSTHCADLADVVADTAISWIEGQEDDDFFLFVWNDGTHLPYLMPDEYDVEFRDSYEMQGTNENLKGLPEDRSQIVSDLYDENVRYNDEAFGRVIAHLKDEGLYQDTTVAATADHGELLDEHTRFEHANSAAKKAIATGLPEEFLTKYGAVKRTALVGHQAVLPYDELLRVPLVVKGPGKEFSRDGSVEALAQLVDLAPTILDIVEGLEVPESFQGRSLLPAVERDETVNDYVYSSNPILFGSQVYHTVRDKHHKYVRTELKNLDSRTWREVRANPKRMLFTLAQTLLTQRELLFDVEDGETRVTNDDDAWERLDEFRGVFENWDNSEDNYDVQTDDKVMENLRDLGYLE